MNRRDFGRQTAGGLAWCALARSGLAAEKHGRPFRLSVMLWTLSPKYTTEQAIDLVAAAGYDGFELTDQDRAWSAADLARVRVRMRQLDIVCDAVSGIKAGFAEPGAAQPLLEQLDTRMGQAEKLSCRRIILLSGKRDPALSREKQHGICVQNLIRAGDAAAERGFELLLEPIDALENPAIYLTRVAEALEIARAVNRANVQVLCDFYHEQQGTPGLLDSGGASGLLAPLRGNIDLLGLVHVADVPGRHAPGTGTVDYPAIYRGLRKQGYDGWMAMEFLPLRDAATELRKAAEQTGGS